MLIDSWNLGIEVDHQKINDIDLSLGILNFFLVFIEEQRIETLAVYLKIIHVVVQ